VDAQDKDGRSAMHYAYLYGDDMMIYTLQKAGAREDLLDKDGRTPEDLLRLDIADSVKEVVSTLASIEIDAYRPECARHNADIDCPDTGRTLLDLIKEQRREALEALIDVSKGKGC
jgi:ankyrin repeat protein